MRKYTDVRKSRDNGISYPLEKSALHTLLEGIISGDTISDPIQGKIRALLLPSAPYSVSSTIYSAVYNQLHGSSFDEIFLFSDPVLHKIDKVAFADYKYWETPLGDVESSHRISQICSADDHAKDEFIVDNSAHEGEVSIEMQLPFLQHTLKTHFKLVPFMHGNVSSRVVHNQLAEIVDNNDLLIAVSSLSRGLPKEYASDLDNRSLKALQSYNFDQMEATPDGFSSPHSALTLSYIAKYKGWKNKLMSYELIDVAKEGNQRLVGAAGLLYYE